MSKRIVQKCLAGVAAVAMTTAAFGSEQSEASRLDSPVVDVPSGEVSPGAFTVLPRTRVLKTGEGRLTVSTADIRQGWKAGLDVREGSLKITGAPKPATAVPADVSNTLAVAACWLDTSLGSSVVRDGSGNVTDLLDVRETGTSATGYMRVRGHVDTVLTVKYPLLRQDATYGKRGLYFQGTKSGCWMNLVTTGGANQKYRAYNLFAVQGITQNAGLGNLFGVRANGADAAHYATQHGDSTARTPIWTDNEGEMPLRARTYVNGDMVDGKNNDNGNPQLPLGFSLLEVEMASSYTEVGCFFNDRDMAQGFGGKTPPSPFVNNGGVRIGGEYLSEVLIFTNRLTTAQRLGVESYLMEKWFGVQRPPHVVVAASPDAEVLLPVNASGNEYIQTKVTGDGRAVLSAGATFVNASLPVVAESGARYSVSEGAEHPLCTRTDDAAADSLVKEGSGDLKVDTLPETLRKVSVDAGSLTLTAPARTGAGRRVYGILANPSFELGLNGQDQIWVGGGFQGWKANYTDYTNDDGVWIYNSSVNGAFNADTWGFPRTVPDGVATLVIKRNGSAYTDLELPEDGTYRVTLKAASRRHANGDTDWLGYNHILNLAVGADKDHLETFACLRTSSYGGFFTYSFRMPCLAKGKYQFWFKSAALDKDRCTLIDDIRVVREEPTDDWLLPNGNFDELKPSYDHFTSPNLVSTANATALAGWTLTQPASLYKAHFSVVTPVSSVMYTSNQQNDSFRGWLHNLNENDGSPLDLHLCGGGSASCTFTPPKGVFKLRSDAKMIRLIWTYAAVVTYRAQLTYADSTTVDLGSVKHSYTHENRTDTFPVAVAFDGETPVTLKLWVEYTAGSNVYDASLVIDNVRLSPTANLVNNGDFESGDWTYVAGSPNGKGTAMTCHRVSYDDSAFPAQFGGSVASGKRGLRVVSDSTAKTSVTIPEGGVYRLSAVLRTRGGYGGGENPVTVTLKKGGVTKTICEAVVQKSQNFTPQSWNFSVAEPGTYELAFRGGFVAQDRTTLVDDVSIVPAAFAADAPVLGSNAVIRVAADARLVLDYVGTGTAYRVIHDGVRLRNGLHSATDCDFITGPGCLKVDSRVLGAAVLVR